MLPRWRVVLGGLTVLGLVSSLRTAEPAGNGYSPVAPTAAIHAALKTNLKTVEDWLGDKDFASAQQSAQGLAALAQLYILHGDASSWRAKTTALAAAANRLTAAAKAGDAAACADCTRECGRLLDQLAGMSPGNRSTARNFKPAATRTWMLLMDGAYSDAKTATNSKDLANLAYAIAEEANAVAHLRTEGSWQKIAAEVSGKALDVATKAERNDLQAARAGLKSVYGHCEACHEISRR